jgi:hypothetical protein
MYKFKITIDKTKIPDVNNSTVFTDVSGKRWTANGNAKLTTSAYKFTPASGVFDGTLGSYITTPDHADFAMGTGDYTIDFWFKTTQTTQGFIYYQGDSVATPSTTAPFINVINNKLRFVPDYSLDPSYHLLESTGSVNDGVWHHAACMRYGNVFSLYVDGVFQTSVTFSYTSIDSAYPVYIGQLSTVSLSFAGNLDEFRVSKGIARWTSAFTPSTSKYVSDSYTKVLLHFGSLTNFTYLFSELCASIPVGFWTHVVDTSTGLDVRFFDTDGVTELKREVVLYSAGTSKVESWVQIPFIDNTADKEIWCQYGGPTVANSTAVWSDIRAKSVLHFQNLTDSSPNGYNASNNGADSTTGKIENAYSFVNANSDYMTVPNSSAINYATGVSVSFWIKFNTIPAAYRSPVAQYPQGGDGWTFDIHPNDGGKWNYFYLKKSATIVLANDSVTTLATGVWYYYTGTYDPVSGYANFYLNGVNKATSPQQKGLDVSSTNLINIGRRPDATTGYVDAVIDEVKVYSTPLNADQIATEYANQNAPATFSTASAETEVTTTYKFKITVDKTKVTGTNTNFVYMFKKTASIPAGFWAHVKDPAGLDIRFYDTDGSTELKRELVTFDVATQTVEAWVQIPSLGTATDKEIWCKYNGSTAANDTTIWTDVNATAIYHLQDAANASVGGVNLTVSGATQVGTGKINKAYSFNGSSDYMTATKVVHSGQYTIAVWAYLTGSAPFAYKMVTADATGYSFLFAFTETDPLTVYKGTGWGIARYAGSWQGTYSGDTYASQKDSWHRVIATYDGDKFRIYVDGVLKNTSASWTIPACSSNLTVGEYASQFWVGGTLDELNYYSDAKSGDWIATEYANQNAPSTFSTASNEQQVSKEATLIMWVPGI